MPRKKIQSGSKITPSVKPATPEQQEWYMRGAIDTAEAIIKLVLAEDEPKGKKK